MSRQEVAKRGSDLSRRRVLAWSGALSVAAFLPGCATTGFGGGPDLYTRAVRQLLELSTRNAFARLTQPNGFWDSAVARVNLPVLFGKRGTVMAGILRTPAFRDKLQRRLNVIAEDGARAAAPLVADAVRTIGVENAMAIIKGEPTGATTFLRGSMGPALVNAMIPELDRLMRMTDDPLLGQALSALAGVDLRDAAHALALEADNAIWYAIGAEEAAIRRDPAAGGDPLLQRVLRS